MIPKEFLSCPEIEITPTPDFSKAEVFNDTFFWWFIQGLFNNMVAQESVKKDTRNSLKNMR